MMNGLRLKNENNIDLFNLLGIILDDSIPREKAKKKAIRYSEGHKTGKKVIITFAGAVNCKLDHNIFEQGDGSMCTLFDEIEKEGEARADCPKTCKM